MNISISLRHESNIVVAVLFIQQKEGQKDQFKSKINFYENKYLGTGKDPSKQIGELINTITISEGISNLVPNRLVEKTVHLKKFCSKARNIFILLSNVGCTCFQVCHDEDQIKFEEIDEDHMVTWLPELHKWRKTGRALALDVFLNEEEVFFTKKCFFFAFYEIYKNLGLFEIVYLEQTLYLYGLRKWEDFIGCRFFDQ